MSHVVANRAGGDRGSVHVQNLRQRLLWDQNVGEASLSVLVGEVNQREAMTVGRDDLALFSLLFQERSHQLEAGLLRGDGVEHFARHPFPEVQGKGDLAFALNLGNRRKVFGGLRYEAEARTLERPP